MFLCQGVVLVDHIRGFFYFKESSLWAMNYSVKEFLTP